MELFETVVCVSVYPLSTHFSPYIYSIKACQLYRFAWLFLSAFDLDKFSRRHAMSAQLINIFVYKLILMCPCVRVQRNTSLFYQQCFVCLTWMVSEMGGKWLYSYVFRKWLPGLYIYMFLCVSHYIVINIFVIRGTTSSANMLVLRWQQNISRPGSETILLIHCKKFRIQLQHWQNCDQRSISIQEIENPDTFYQIFLYL